MITKNYHHYFIRAKKLFLLLFVCLVFPVFVLAQASSDEEYIVNPIINPSAAYCEGLGYKFILEETPEGQLGMCKFSETEQAEAWKFLSGEEAQKYSYCNKSGYEMKVIDDTIKCGQAYVPNFGCLACVLKDGSEVAAGNLLEQDKMEKLTKTETVSSICKIDGQCLSGEDTQNCPNDCIIKEKANNYFVILIAVLLIIIFAIIGVVFMIKRKKE